MKLVLLLQFLFGVAVLGRSIEPLTEPDSPAGDEQRYRFRYQVADDITGDFKSQSETRDETGVISGTYRVLQPDGCVRVVHYTADAMGFHPTVTYEGDCQQGKSITSSDDGQQSDEAVPSSSASLSRPVHSAVPGLEAATTADRQDSIQEAILIPRPVQTDPVDESSDIAAAKFISSPLKIPASIANLWQQLRPSTGAPETTTVSSTTQAPTTTITTTTVLPKADEVDTVIIENDQLETKSVDVVAPVEQVESRSAAEVVPSLTSIVETRETVPESITTLLQSFQPTDAVKEQQADPLVAQPSELQVTQQEPESINKQVELTQLSDAESRDSTKVTVESIGGEESSSKQVETDDSQSRTSDSSTLEGSEGVPAGSRTSITSLAQTVLTSVQNFTSSLTNFTSSLTNLSPLNLIPNVTVQNLVPKPVGELLQSFNKKPTTTTPSPDATAPSVKMPSDDSKQLDTMLVTDHHHDAIQSDGPAVLDGHSENRETSDESGLSGVWNAVKTTGASLETVELRSDPAVESRSVEGLTDPVSIPAIGDLSTSSDLETIGDQPVVHDAMETQHIDELANDETSFDDDQLTNEPVAAESRRSLEDERPVPGTIIFSGKIETGSFIVRHPPASPSMADQMETVDRHGTARALSDYGMRSRAFARSGHVAPQRNRARLHSRPTYGRLTPAAPTLALGVKQQHSSGYGMRHNTPVQLKSPLTNGHYPVRPMAPVVRSPVYSRTYVN